MENANRSASTHSECHNPEKLTVFVNQDGPRVKLAAAGDTGVLTGG